jgi:dsDNA-specific endonuclease/ATPase MutS2
MTVATTHLGTLKELASQVDGVVNASLQFDAVALAPTYRLIKGIPGRSYGISIARRLRLPEHVVTRAEERLPQQERDVAALIAQLEKREEELKTREKETAAVLDDARTRMADIAKRERNVRERERLAEKTSRQDARRYLLDARAEIERTIKELKSKGIELRGDDAVVAVGVMKLTVSRKTLSRVDQPAPQEHAGVWTGDLPEVHVPTEIDLRGMRLDEAESYVMQSLDAAVRADLKGLRIIHGKGTGALRERVTEMLRKDTRVRSFRLGSWNEGGAGVTLADFA